MQDIVLCSQLASRHGLLVGLTETKKQSLLFMNRVSIGIVLLKCCKTQVAKPQKIPNKQNLQNSKPRNSDL